MKTFRHFSWMFVLAFMTACNAVPESHSGSGVPTAVDWVCKYNGDLACVDVPITAQTPSYEYNGKMYYFCSPTCKAAFIKEPGKYLPK